MTKYLKCLIFTSILFFKSYSQNLKYRKIYSEKTPILITPYDSTQNFNSINVFPSFVDYRLYKNHRARAGLHDSGFVCKLIDIDTNYISYPKNAKIIHYYFDYKLAKKLNKITSIHKPKISSTDSVLIIRELRKIKKILKDSVLHEYVFGDSLNTIFSRYPADNEAIVDITYYQSIGFAPKSINHWAIVKFFVFDFKRKKIIFYNYKIECGGWRYDMFVNEDAPTKIIFPLIFRYKKYIRKNSKFIIKKR